MLCKTSYIVNGKTLVENCGSYTLCHGLHGSDQPPWRHYLVHQAENVFYHEASFYSGSEVERLLKQMGFVD